MIEKRWSWRKWEVERNWKNDKQTTIVIHSDLHSIISITSSTQKINNVYVLSTRHYCCHLHQLHITYTIYNVIYTHYNRRRIIIRSKVSLFLVFSQRFEDFYRELLERINECKSLFIRVNNDIKLLRSRTNFLRKEDNFHDELTHRS